MCYQGINRNPRISTSRCKEQKIVEKIRPWMPVVTYSPSKRMRGLTFQKRLSWLRISSTIGFTMGMNPCITGTHSAFFNPSSVAK